MPPDAGQAKLILPDVVVIVPLLTARPNGSVSPFAAYPRTRSPALVTASVPEMESETPPNIIPPGTESVAADATESDGTLAPSATVAKPFAIVEEPAATSSAASPSS